MAKYLAFLSIPVPFCKTGIILATLWRGVETLFKVPWQYEAQQVANLLTSFLYLVPFETAGFVASPLLKNLSFVDSSLVENFGELFLFYN